MCNLSWTPHSSLEKDNSLNHSSVSPYGLFGVSNHNRANGVAVCACVCGNGLLQRLMSPSPKSQVMFASAFS